MAMVVDVLTLLTKESFYLGAVVGVNAEERQLFAHAGLGDVEHQVEVLPELFLNGLSGLVVELNLGQTESLPDSVGSLEAFITLEMAQLALVSQDEQVE